MGNIKSRHGYQAEVSGVRTRTNAAQIKGREKHSENFGQGGSYVNKKMTRLMALFLVALMLFGIVATALTAILQ